MHARQGQTPEALGARERARQDASQARPHAGGHDNPPAFIKDRQRAGIEAAKARGVYKGRPVTFDHAKIVALRKQGLGATEIARAVGCKRGNVYKALKAAGVA
jgi:hypothetical protein